MISGNTQARAGRPKSEEKREAIRHAAIGLFMSEGLQRTSMDAVAEAAGVSKQTVYSHFECKDSLFRECVCSKMSDYGLQPEAIPDDLDAAGALARFARQFLELLQDPEVVSMFRLLAGECTSYPAIARVFYEAGPAQTRQALASMLARFSARGELRVDDPMESAALFITMVQGRYFLELLLGVRERVEAEELERHLSRGIARFVSLHRPA